jgi:hypothetical protein
MLVPAEEAVEFHLAPASTVEAGVVDGVHPTALLRRIGVGWTRNSRAGASGMGLIVGGCGEPNPSDARLGLSRK